MGGLCGEHTGGLYGVHAGGLYCVHAGGLYGEHVGGPYGEHTGGLYVVHAGDIYCVHAGGLYGEHVDGLYVERVGGLHVEHTGTYPSTNYKLCLIKTKCPVVQQSKKTYLVCSQLLHSKMQERDADPRHTFSRTLTHITLHVPWPQGMGEPLLALPSVVQAYKLLNEQLGIGGRYITISTVGEFCGRLLGLWGGGKYRMGSTNGSLLSAC